MFADTAVGDLPGSALDRLALGVFALSMLAFEVLLGGCSHTG